MGTVKDIFPKYLFTSRLTLELWDGSPEHYALVLRSLNTPAALQMADDWNIRTPEQLDNLVNGCRLRDPRFRDGTADCCVCYIVRLGSREVSAEMIGYISVAHRRVFNETDEAGVLAPDLGWCFLDTHMGQGYATEAAREVARCLREDLGITDLTVFASERNQRSNRVAEKLGFVDGGQCANLDEPGQMYSIWITPGMSKLNETVKGGLRLRPKERPE